MIKRSLLSGAALIATALLLSDCTTGRIIWHRTSDPDDHKIFDTRALRASESHNQFTFAYNPSYTARIEALTIAPPGWKEEGLRALPSISLNEFLRITKTNAFLVIRNDTILYEKYFNGYTESTVANSFSMGKTVTSSLVGIALKEGLINSITDPITRYIPELRNKPGFERIQIIHLLQMTSGIRFTENYLWFSDVAYLYYTKDRKKFFTGLSIESPPGVKWKYKSIDSALLSLVIANATGRTVSEYAEEKLWKPLGMETDAQWAIDDRSNGVEKTDCCLFATARDFARFGRLYLNRGNIDDKQIISPEFYEKSISLDTTEGSIFEYQYQWWMPWWLGKINDPFYAHGYKGQRLIISPSKKIIIVKLSNDSQGDRDNREYYMELFRKILDGNAF